MGAYNHGLSDGAGWTGLVDWDSDGLDWTGVDRIALDWNGLVWMDGSGVWHGWTAAWTDRRTDMGMGILGSAVSLASLLPTYLPALTHVWGITNGALGFAFCLANLLSSAVLACFECL